MSKKTFLLVLFFLLMYISCSFAQHNYKTGIGLRGGSPSGITGKHFMSNSTAVEGIVSFGWWGGFGVTGLFQIHNPIPNAQGFKWYYGAGAHLATSNADKQSPWSGASGSKLFLGVDGVIGAEYVFADAPVSVSVDILPILNLIETIDVWFNAGLSIRYTLK
jgi:hypothetical protein